MRIVVWQGARQGVFLLWAASGSEIKEERKGVEERKERRGEGVYKEEHDEERQRKGERMRKEEREDGRERER